MFYEQKGVSHMYIYFMLFCVGFYVFEFLRATSNVSAENSPGKCEYTIVIDAGHGGADGGAVASDGISER